MEKEVFTVNLEKVIREMKLDRLYYPNKEVLIDTADLNRRKQTGTSNGGIFRLF